MAPTSGKRRILSPSPQVNTRSPSARRTSERTSARRGWTPANAKWAQIWNKNRLACSECARFWEADILDWPQTVVGKLPVASLGSWGSVYPLRQDGGIDRKSVV